MSAARDELASVIHDEIAPMVTTWVVASTDHQAVTQALTERITNTLLGSEWLQEHDERIQQACADAEDYMLDTHDAAVSKAAVEADRARRVAGTRPQPKQPPTQHLSSMLRMGALMTDRDELAAVIEDSVWNQMMAAALCAANDYLPLAPDTAENVAYRIVEALCKLPCLDLEAVAKAATKVERERCIEAIPDAAFSTEIAPYGPVHSSREHKDGQWHMRKRVIAAIRDPQGDGQ